MNKIKAEDNAPTKVSSDSKKEEDYMSGAKVAFGNILTYGVYIIAIVFAFVFIIKSLHLILPSKTCQDCWIRCWLDDQQLKSIDQMLSGSVLGAVLGSYIRTIVK